MEESIAKAFTGNHLVLLFAIGVSTFFLKGLLTRFDAMNVTLGKLITKVAVLDDRYDTTKEDIKDIQSKLTKVGMKAGQCHANLFGANVNASDSHE